MTNVDVFPKIDSSQETRLYKHRLVFGRQGKF